MKSLKSGPKKWMNPQSAAIAVSRNPLKYRFESETWAKKFKIRRSVGLFTFTPLFIKVLRKKGPDDKRASL